MLGRIYSIAIFNQWLKPLTKNVSYVVVGLLNYSLEVYLLLMPCHA
jgi:hypothetical protein